MDISFQQPTEGWSLWYHVIPKLCKTKRDLLLFFEGAGIL